jgi:glycosyl transferase family 2
MSLTIAIPTKLHNPMVRASVEAAVVSAARVGPDAEVLVVANGPASDEVLARIDAPSLRVIRQDRLSAPAARNGAVAAARHDTVLLTDDDCLVPPQWGAELAAALAAPDVAVVAAPVRVRATGGPTGYLSYQRTFDAPPVDAGIARYPVLCCTGLRRDRLGAAAWINDADLPEGADDTELGYTLAEAGHAVHFAGAAAPLEHVIEDEMEQVTARFWAYGRGNAQIVIRRGRWEQSIPGILDWYRALAVGYRPALRQFAEVTDPVVASVFALYDLLLNASFLVGYLTQTGQELGATVLHLDRDALLAGWRQVADEARELAASVPAAAWAAPAVDYGRFTAPGPARGPDLIERAAAVLAQHAPLAAELPGEVQAALATGAERLRGRQDETGQRLAAAWTAFRAAGALDDADALDRELRAAGIAFREGGHRLETSLRPAAPTGPHGHRVGPA